MKKRDYRNLTDAELIGLLFEELAKADMLVQCREEELLEREP